MGYFLYGEPSKAKKIICFVPDTDEPRAFIIAFFADICHVSPTVDRKTRRNVLLGGLFLLLLVVWYERGAGERRSLRDLRSDKPEVRFAAIRGLEASGSSRAITAIEQHVQDPDSKVASRAVLALGNLASPETIRQVEQAAADPRVETREAAVVALGRTGGKRAGADTQVLIHALESDPSYIVRGAAALALGRLRAKEGLPALLAATSDPSLHVATQAAISATMITGAMVPCTPGHPSAQTAALAERTRSEQGK